MNSSIQGDRLSSSGGYALASRFFPGRLQVFFDNIPIGLGLDYRVVDTDYTSYAITYSCIDFFFRRNNDVSFLIVRDPLVEGTADYTAMLDKVDPIYAEKIPDYPKQDRMFTTK